MRLRVALIGAGRIARVHALSMSGLTALGSVELVGVADTSPPAAEAMAEPFGCPFFVTLEALCEAVAPDFVIVCTPAASHADISLFFLERGIVVLCEKPLGLDLAEAREMVETAMRNSTLLMLSAKFLYASDVVLAAGIVASGNIGNVTSVHVDFSLSHDMSRDWRSDRATSGGGVLIDKGPHCFDIMRLFLGPLCEVRAILRPGAPGDAIEQAVSIDVRCASGAIGHGYLSWLGGEASNVFTTITGDEGSIELGWMTSRFRRTGEEWRTIGCGYSQKQAFRAQFERFVEMLQDKPQMQIDPVELLGATAFVEAGYQSAALGSWTRFEL